MESLHNRLKDWDGIHMAYLKETYDLFINEQGFFDYLIDALKDEGLQAAASWLIKHHYDKGDELGKQLSDKLIVQTPNLSGWEAQLHILQIISKLRLSPEHYILLDDFIRRTLKSTNKFVRAWSYQGLFELYKHQVVGVEELRSLCELAMETESAAIQSKVRKILRAINK